MNEGSLKGGRRGEERGEEGNYRPRQLDSIQNTEWNRHRGQYHIDPFGCYCSHCMSFKEKRKIKRAQQESCEEDRGSRE